MLLKIALQMARDDYEQRKKRQAAGIAEAKNKDDSKVVRQILKNIN